MDKYLSLYIVWLRINVQHMLQKNITFEDFKNNPTKYKGSIKYFISLLLVIIYDMYPEISDYKISEMRGNRDVYHFLNVWSEQVCYLTKERCVHMIDSIDNVLEGEADKWIEYHKYNKTPVPQIILRQ